jgi:hypothetical protein
MTALQLYVDGDHREIGHVGRSCVSMYISRVFRCAGRSHTTAHHMRQDLMESINIIQTRYGILTVKSIDLHWSECRHSIMQVYRVRMQKWSMPTGIKFCAVGVRFTRMTFLCK